MQSTIGWVAVQYHWKLDESVLYLDESEGRAMFTSFNLGFSEECLAHVREQCDRMCEERRAAGGKGSFLEGIFIFDEVKVGLKLHYHAKTGQFISLAMSSDELGSLQDLYQTLQSDHRMQKASYVLQLGSSLM